jgi:hypothetical protein
VVVLQVRTIFVQNLYLGDFDSDFAALIVPPREIRVIAPSWVVSVRERIILRPKIVVQHIGLLKSVVNREMVSTSICRA